MNIEAAVKKICKRFFIPAVQAPGRIKEFYNQIGPDLAEERTFFFGTRRLKVKSLKMESAPGTAETTVKLLQESHRGDSVLDYGCGQQQSLYLRRAGFNVHSADVIDFKIPNFTRINPDAGKLPFGDKQFDVTVASEVLEHLESPWETLRELARITRRSIIVTTPNTVSKKSRRQFFRAGFLYWFAPENFSYHISPIFPWQMELFCRRHGLRLAKMLGNHQIFGLNDYGRTLDYAESLIFKIDL